MKIAPRLRQVVNAHSDRCGDDASLRFQLGLERELSALLAVARAAKRATYAKINPNDALKRDLAFARALARLEKVSRVQREPAATPRKKTNAK